MSAPLFRISWSKIASFERCRKQYWFRYLSGLEWPPDAQTPAGIIGSGVHRAMKVLAGTDNRDDGAHELETYLRMPVHEPAGPGTSFYDTAFELYRNGVDAHDSIASDDRWAELDTWVPAHADGVNVSARLDRADRFGDGSWQVVDWKTTRGEPTEQTDRQLDIGHLTLRTVFRQIDPGREITAIAWNLRTGSQRVRRLTRADAEKTHASIVHLAQRIQATTDFASTPGPACTFCDWRDQCPDAASPWQPEVDDDLPETDH